MANDTRKADFSNVQSGVQSTAPDAKADFSDVQSGVSSTADTPTTYTVESGDSLSAIAQRIYGRASLWRSIFEANRDQLDNPDRIQPGQVLRIPHPPGQGDPS